MTSLSQQIAIKSLNKLLAGDWDRSAAKGSSASAAKDDKSKKTERFEVRFFFRVLFRHKLTLVSKIKKGFPYSSNTLEQESSPSQAPLLYICLCENDVVLVDPLAKWAPYKPAEPDPNSPEYKALQEQGRLPKKSARRNPHIIMVIPYLAITEVIADTLREEVFGLGVESTEKCPLAYDIPIALRFSCSFRKQLVESLQICCNVHAMITRNKAVSLPVRFAPLALANRKGPPLEGVTDKRLATFQFFHHGRIPPEYRNKKVFYRSEHMFMGPDDMTDRYETLPNRPCSTYTLNNNNAADGGPKGPQTYKGKGPENPRLIVKFLPPRNLSDMGSMTKARDLLSNSLAAEDDESLQSVELSQAGLSDVEFQFWVESIAMALAMNEESKDQFFLPEKGTYFKKLNVVQDKAAWVCYRVHVFTRNRQIGVIGCRRKFLPPHLDSFQDMLFVLYGPNFSTLRTEPGFMRTLESIVDSLSPVVAPLPFKEADLLKYAPEATLKDPTRAVHATYCDRELVQARANTLLYTCDQFKWLSTRDWLKDPQRTATGVVPRTRFIDLECFDLATKFCASVLSKVKMGSAPSSTRDDQKAVADPLAIIFRMMAELDQDQDDDAAPRGAAAPKRNVEDAGDVKNGYSLREEWRCRVASYFAYCVDGGVLPKDLTLYRLVTSDAVDEKAVDAVIAFLLYMKPKPRKLKNTPLGLPYEEHSSVIEKFWTSDILTSFTCNEDVLVKLLQANYFENAAKRQAKPGVVTRLFRSILVTKLYNLKLVRVTCLKIAKQRYDNDEILIDPLINLVKIGNFFIKAWAFQGLAALAARHELAIFDKGGVGMAIWSVYTSRSAELIEAALELLVAVAHDDKKLQTQPYVILTQPDLARKLIHLLAPFEKTDQQERYHPNVLERSASLILKLAPDRGVLNVLLENGAHNHLARIVDKHERYHQILVKVTAALGTIYLHAGSVMTKLRYSRKETQERDAMGLVMALKEHTTPQKAQLCLNILIVLRKILDFFEVPLPQGDQSFKRFWDAVQDRVDLLVRLKDAASMDLVLDRCKRLAEEITTIATNAKLKYEQTQEYEHATDSEKTARRAALDTQIKIGNGVLNKYNWFAAIIEYCKTRSNSTKHFQHDGQKLQPLELKEN